MRVLCLDYETSGIDRSRHAPVQLGVAIMEGDDVIASNQWIIGPPTHWKTGAITREYSVPALEISGISWKAIKSAPGPGDILDALDAFAMNNEAWNMPIVAFNAAFDFGFYSEHLFMGGGYDRDTKGFMPAIPPLVGPWHCAMLMARKAITGLENYKLDSVAAHFGLSREGEKHGALEDAIIAGKVFHRLRGLL